MNRILIVLILLCPVFGYSQYCTPDNRFTEVEYFTDTQIEKDTGVVYATNVIDWLGNSQDLALDFYYPDTTIDPLSSRPFILLIHGGGFKNGSKSGLSIHCEEFAKRGYVAASLQYRLGWDTTGTLLDQLPAVYRAQQDANAAMRFIIEYADNYQIDTSWMFIGGQSAGSITALGTHYIDQDEWNFVFPAYESSYGSIDTSGNNFTHEFNFKGIFNNWGNTFGSAIEPHELVPMISFHGVLDNTTPIDSKSDGRYGSAIVHNLLISNGICSELNVDSTGENGIYPNEFRVKKAICFFKSMFCNDCSSAYITDSIPANCSIVLSTEEPDNINELFKVYPNPVNNYLTINGVIGNYEINVIDITGKIITATEMLAGNEIINVSNLTKGMYLIQIINQENGSLEQIKFIKE